MSDAPTVASPVTAPNPVASIGGATVTDRSQLAKVAVKTTASSGGGLGPAFGHSEVVGDALVCGSRPDEWLVIGDPEAVAAVVSGAGTAHVVDMTHGRLLFEVAGPSATAALEKVCSLDWSDAMLPDGAVTAGSVAKVSCDLIVRRDRHGEDGTPERAYLLAADRSFGQYLYDALVDACDEFR